MGNDIFIGKINTNNEVVLQTHVRFHQRAEHGLLLAVVDRPACCCSGLLVAAEINAAAGSSLLLSTRLLCLRTRPLRCNGHVDKHIKIKVTIKIKVYLS